MQFIKCPECDQGSQDPVKFPIFHAPTCSKFDGAKVPVRPLPLFANDEELETFGAGFRSALAGHCAFRVKCSEEQLAEFRAFAASHRSNLELARAVLDVLRAEGSQV